MLTPERIMKLEQQSYVKGHRPVSTEDCWGDEKITYEPTEHFNIFMFARAIEAEVRKQDAKLMQTMLEVFETLAYKLPENKSTTKTCYAINDIDRDCVHSMANLLRKRLENT